MLSTQAALEKLLALAPALRVEMVPLAEADGRVLARDAVSERAQPPFAASAMDGYAVRAAEAVAGAVLTVTGEAAAGHRAGIDLRSGAAIRIFTGAPVPQGADAILIQENATREADRITVHEAPMQGAFIRPAGGDFPAGFYLSAPRRLGPRDVALLAAMNQDEVAVMCKPVVALIPTGDELVPPGAHPGPDQIITSNNYGLAGMLARIGAVPRLCPIARDNRESLLAALSAAEGADIIVTLGGASVGDHDLVAEVFGEAGLSLDFYKVAMRPGKPLMAGRIGARVMIGLPGNPVSALVCGEIFLRPMIEASFGLATGKRQRLSAQLAHDLEKNGPREHYMRARLTDGSPSLIEVFEDQDSSRLAILARSNVLVVRPPQAAAARAGDFVEYIPLD